MRSTFLLLKDIQKELEDAFSKFPLRAPTETEGYRIPQIWIGHAPPKQSIPASAGVEQTAGDPPFCIVRTLDGEIKPDSGMANERMHELKVGILCCVYSYESFTTIEAGYNDILNMVDRILFTLNKKYFWEENNWEFIEPIKWTTGLQKELGIYDAGAHEHPIYGAAAIATFRAKAYERPSLIGITNTKEA